MKRLLLALACVVPLAACGGGSDADTTTTSRAQVPSTTTGAARAPSTTTGGAPTTSTTSRGSGASSGDARIARAAVLRRGDFAAEWKMEVDDSPSPTSRCAGIRTARSATSGRAPGATFTRGGAQVESTVYVYADRARASAALRSLTSAATRRCAAGVVTDQSKGRATAGARTGRATAAAVRAAPFGDEVGAFRIELPVTAKGRTSRVPFRFTILRKGRGLSIVSIQGFDDPAVTRQLQRIAEVRLTVAFDTTVADR